MNDTRNLQKVLLLSLLLFFFWTLPAIGYEVTSLTQLTNGSIAESGCTFNANGTKIAYRNMHSPYSWNNCDIWVMNTNGSGKTQITTDSRGEFDPRFAPDGRITYTKEFGSNDYDLWIVNGNGSNPYSLIGGSYRQTSCRWNPSGNKLVYCSEYQYQGPSEIWTANPDGSAKVQLTNHNIDGYRQGEPVYSRSGNLIAYTNTVTNTSKSAVWVMNANGSGKHQITSGSSSQTPMFWWPDDSKIGYTQNGEVWLHNLSTGTDELLLSVGGGNIGWCDLSSDGTKLVFDASDSHIWIGDVSSGSQEPDITVNLTGEAFDLAHDLVISWEGASEETVLESCALEGEDLMPYIISAADNTVFVPAMCFPYSTSLELNIGLRVNGTLVEETHQLDVESGLKEFIDLSNAMPWDVLAVAIGEEWPDVLGENIEYLDFAASIDNLMDALSEQDYALAMSVLFSQGESALFSSMYGGGSLFTIDQFGDWMIFKPNRNAFTDEEWELVQQQPVLTKGLMSYGLGISRLLELLASSWTPAGAWIFPSPYLPPEVSFPMQQQAFLDLAWAFHDMQEEISKWFEDLFHVFVMSPVEIEIVDPLGRILTQTTSDIPYTFFIITQEPPVNHPVEHYYTYMPESGDYTIFAYPALDSVPEDVFSIYAIIYGEEEILAEDTMVANIPQEGYSLRVVPPLKGMLKIAPDTLNRNSKGKWITCYIELPEDYDVSQINVNSLMLQNNVIAESEPTKIGDYDSDGISDLMVKFDRRQLIGLLEAGEQVIDLTGQLIDGTPLVGIDTIRIINPKEDE